MIMIESCRFSQWYGQQC